MAGAASPPSALAAWTCPLTGQLFVEPVLYLAPNDGAAQIYERAALEQQLASLGITGDDRGRLVPVEAVRFAVEAAVAGRGAPGAGGGIGGALAAAARAPSRRTTSGPAESLRGGGGGGGRSPRMARPRRSLPAELRDEAESVPDAKQPT